MATLDFDQRRAERGRDTEPIVVRVMGRTTELPPVLPASSIAAFASALGAERDDDGRTKVTPTNFAAAMAAICDDLNALGFDTEPLRLIAFDEVTALFEAWGLAGEQVGEPSASSGS